MEAGVPQPPGLDEGIACIADGSSDIIESIDGSVGDGFQLVGRARRLGVSAVLWQSSVLFSTLTTIFLTLIIARVQGPDWYGDLSTFLFISGVGSTVGAMGIPNAISKYVSELDGKKNRRGAAAFSRKQIRMVFKSGIISAVGVLAAMTAVFVAKGYDDYASLVVIAISVPVTILFSAATQLSVGLQNFRSVLVSNVVSKSFLIVVGLTVVLLDFPLFLYLAVMTCSVGIGAVLQYRASRIYRFEGGGEPIPEGLESRARGYGKALWVNTVLDLILFTQAGTFFLWLFAGSDVAGQFGIAYTLTYTITALVSGSIVASLFPEFSRLYGARDTEGSIATFRIGFKANALVIIPTTAMLVLGGSAIASVLFGASFDQAGEVVFMLAFSSGFVAVGTLTSSYGYAHEKHATWMWVSVSMSVLAIFLFIVLVPTMGLLGAVIVQSSVWILSTCICYYLVISWLKLSIPWRFCGIVAIAAALVYSAIFFAVAAVFSGLPLLLVWGSSGTVAYLAIVWLLSKYDDDASTILRTAATILRTAIRV